MDFMKVFDQTVREIKREVNLKVLKVPEIEQKVLDATNDEAWGPHGSALAEIAQATKKFSECSMVMNVLWTRLSETNSNWRYVYKALAVIEYLVSNGSERAVDDIIEHTFQISSLTSFEFVEPNGKDSGINVRKKAETIVALLNNKDKIQEVRNKAASNRDKYFGLSSTAFKSGSASFSSNTSRSSDTYKDSFKDDDGFEKFASSRSRMTGGKQESSPKKSSTRKGADTKSSVSSRTSAGGKSSVPAKNSTPSYTEDDFDDFDPRGTSRTKSAAGNSNQVDLFGESFVGDLLDFEPSVPKDTSVGNSNESEADLFADADFVSAPSHVETGGSPVSQPTADLFASKPASSTTVPSSVDFFAASAPVVQPQKNSPKSDMQNTNAVDPFAAVPLNNFDESDLFGAFTSTTDSVSTETAKVQDSYSSNEAKLPSKSKTFNVKSGVWADSLSRGLIDLNITAPKKVSLVDIGVVGGLNDMTDEREKGLPTSYNMGRAMGMGSGMSKSGVTSSSDTVGDDFFSSLGSQQYQFGGFQK